MKVKCKMTREKDKDYSNMKMVLAMVASGKMTCRMAEEEESLDLETPTMVNGKMDKNTRLALEAARPGSESR